MRIWYNLCIIYKSLSIYFAYKKFIFTGIFSYLKKNYSFWGCTKLNIKVNIYCRFQVLKICVWLWFFLDIEKDRKVHSRAEPDCVCPKRSHVGGSSGTGTEDSKWGTVRVPTYIIFKMKICHNITRSVSSHAFIKMKICQNMSFLFNI